MQFNELKTPVAFRNKTFNCDCSSLAHKINSIVDINASIVRRRREYCRNTRIINLFSVNAGATPVRKSWHNLFPDTFLEKNVVLVSTLHSLHDLCISCAYLFNSIFCSDTAPYRLDCVRDEKLREVSVSSFSQADNYAVVMAVDLLKLRAAIIRVSWHFLDE